MSEATTHSGGAYDDLVARLEAIVKELESGGLTLEQSIEKFAQGVELARDASKKLDEAEQRIEMLVRNGDGVQQAVPFDSRNNRGHGGDVE